MRKANPRWRCQRSSNTKRSSLGLTSPCQTGLAAPWLSSERPPWALTSKLSSRAPRRHGGRFLEMTGIPSRYVWPASPPRISTPSATRVWTLIEAGKKAWGLQRIIPEFTASVGGPWLGFSHIEGGVHLEYLCSTLVKDGRKGVLAVAARSQHPPGGGSEDILLVDAFWRVREGCL